MVRVLDEPSSCLRVRQHLGADLGFQHLADFGARKVIPDFNLLRRFDASDPLLHKGRHRGDVDGASCSRLHHSDDAFTPLFIWQTDDGTILNGFVSLEGVLSDKISQPEYLAAQIEIVAQGFGGPLVNHPATLQRHRGIGQCQRQIEIVIDNDDRDFLA